MDTIPLFHNKNIVLGVCGGIAAYKVADLASKLTQAGALVDVILTESATKFVGPVTFAAVTGRSALTNDDLWRHDAACAARAVGRKGRSADHRSGDGQHASPNSRTGKPIICSP